MQNQPQRPQRPQRPQIDYNQIKFADAEEIGHSKPAPGSKSPFELE